MIPTLLLCCGILAAEPSQPSVEELKAYEVARNAAGRDPEAHVRLALWCEQHGMTSKRLQHLALAVLADPANVTARGLLGLVWDHGQWRKPDDVAKRIQDDAKKAAALAEYNERRTRTRLTADSQWKLAVWCEENGLEPEAIAHFTAVVRLDPSRSAAWKRLGCKKYKGRWMTDEQIAAEKAEREAQARADQYWRSTLTHWRAALNDHARQAEATKNLASVRDRRAVPSVWRVFALGNAADQDRAVQLFGQIDAPGASRALVMLALGGATPEIRRAASETLVRCDPHDYMAPLIAMLRKPLRYEVRPVAGPGSAGALFVEGQLFNRMKIYTTAVPNFALVDTGTSWAQDSFGYEVLRLPGRDVEVQHGPTLVATLTGQEFRHGLASPNDPRGVPLEMALGANPNQTRWNVATNLFKPGWGTSDFLIDSDFNVNIYKSTTDYYKTEVSIPIGRIAAEYQKSAFVAQQELANDVAMVEAANQAIKQSNDLVVNLLNNVSDQNLKDDADAWRGWWADQLGYAYQPPPPMPKPTFFQYVPPAYQPRPMSTSTQIIGKDGSTDTFTARAQMTSQGLSRMAGYHIFPCCFAADTLVQTRQGPKPIEKIHIGDQVLSQDVETGALDYRSVLTVFHFRPSATYRLQLGDDQIVTTPLHRFWKAGQGWTMARDLKPGDVLRTLGGTAKVSSIETDKVRPVFNLEVAGNPAFFVGESAALAHDNTPAGRHSAPFDAPPELAQANKTAGR